MAIPSQNFSIEPDSIITTWWAQICYPELSQIMNTRQWHGLERQYVNFLTFKSNKTTTFVNLTASSWFLSCPPKLREGIKLTLEKLKISGVLCWAITELLTETIKIAGFFLKLLGINKTLFRITLYACPSLFKIVGPQAKTSTSLLHKPTWFKWFRAVIWTLLLLQPWQKYLPLSSLLGWSELKGNYFSGILS